MKKQRVLVISHDKVGPSMAGPGIRYHQIATELSKHFETALGVFNPKYIEGLKDTKYQPIDIKTYEFQKEFDKFDAIFALWLSDEMIEYAKAKNIRLIFDLYAPVPVEDFVGRTYANRISESEDKDFISLIRNYNRFFEVGDYFVCSNEIQKDMWTGYAFAGQRITPGNSSNFDIGERIGLLPMGINLDELKNLSNEKPLTKEFKEIKSTDFIVVWTGGIWDWFDGTTPVKAINELVNEGYTNIKFVFLGTKHPNPDIPEMGETIRTIELSKKLGLYDKYVFFREGWIDYDKRLDYLNEASVALYAHRSNLEARYSHRTRVLDHILIGLPTIATKGDYLTKEIKNNGYGISVEPQDVKELKNALMTLIRDSGAIKSMREKIISDRNKFTWSESTKELIKFLKDGNIEVRNLPKTNNKELLLKKSGLVLRGKKYTPERIKKIIRKFI